MATQTATANSAKAGPGRRAEDSEAAGALRRRARDGENGAGERASSADVAGWRRRRDRRRKRRPDRHPPGQGLGADRDRPVRARRSQAAARGAAVAEWQLQRGGRRSAPSTTCASSSWTTTRSFSSRLPTTASGTPISTTSRRRSPTDMDIIFSAFEGWPGIRSPKVKDWIVKHQIPAEGWYVAHPDLSVAEAGRAEAHRQGRRRIPRQGRLSRHAARTRNDRKEKAVMATQTATATEPKQDVTVEEKLQKLRELYADAPEIGKSRAGERAHHAHGRAGSAGAGANRRPYRRPSGQGLGAHRVPSVRERGSEAASRLAAVAGRELPGGGRGRHGPRHALRVRGQRHEVALRDGL